MDYAINPLSVWLGSTFHFIIPPYQRPYGWGPDQLQGIVRDTANSSGQTAHWMGVMLTQSDHHASRASMHVLDGQQRLITLRLWLAALEHSSQPSEAFSVGATFKVSIADEEVFNDIVAGDWAKHIAVSGLNAKSHPVLRAYSYFRYVLWLGDAALQSDDPIQLPNISFAQASKMGSPFEEGAVIDFWEATQAANISKNKNQISKTELTSPEILAGRVKSWNLSRFMCGPSDEPPAQLFSTLNGPRLELDSFDHVRNSVFLELGQSAPEVFLSSWQPAERKLHAAKIDGIRAARTSMFVYDYLISAGESAHQGNLNLKKGAAHFSKHLTRLGLHGNPEKVERFLQGTLLPFVDYWLAAIGAPVSPTGIRNKDIPQLARALLLNIRELSEGPPVPLVALFVKSWAENRLSDRDLERNLHLVESFLIREVLARRALSPLRAKIMNVCGQLQGICDPGSVARIFRASAASDEEIRRLVSAPLYGHATPGRVLAILRGIERALSGNHAHVLSASAFTVEHIYPQKPEKTWAVDIKNWGASTPNAELTHSLGNLTAVTRNFNPKASNKALIKKQEALVNVAEPPLELHATWRQSSTWGKRDIEDRGRLLLEKALEHWRI